MASNASLAKALLAVFIFASMFASGMANREWRFGFNYTDWRIKHRGWWYRHHHHHHHNKTQEITAPNKVIVGDLDNWRFNFSYVDWAQNHGPFYLNDMLVFKYDPPVGEDAHPHSVYQLPDFKSYTNCDLRKAKQLANATQGVGEGFKFVLNKQKPYYFACGESNGFHCNIGRMKFSVMPIIRPNCHA